MSAKFYSKHFHHQKPLFKSKKKAKFLNFCSILLKIQ
ncbi:hypothetical protein N197_03105 [Helicobacter pylori UM023]|nr:hypothetical protein N197_03105 [Helicobacter pylori UM023]